MQEDSVVLEETTLNERFRRDGYVILPGVVSADRLEALRRSVDVLVARQREIDSSWDTCPTPRTDLTQHADSTTLEPVELALLEKTFGMSTQMLGCQPDEVALSAVSVLCNPEFEPVETPPSGQSWGTDPRNWHRDVRPDHDGPLSALLADEQANGPGYVQWNIALYDDSIFCLIPGSHRRLTSEVEAMQLRLEGGTQAPLSGSIRADLKPGDAIAYISMSLHWGSKYTSRRKRRTVHLGYRSFGRFLPHQRECRLRERSLSQFPADSAPRRALEQSMSLFRHEFGVIEEIFRAIVDNDAPRFQAGLARLHPSDDGRLACVILLSKFARDVYKLGQERGNGEPAANGGDTADFNAQLYQQLTSRFTAAERDQLWRRFRRVDEMLRSDEPVHVSGFLGPRTNYLFEQLPPQITVDAAIAAIWAPA